jgi:hypothetical protein
VATKFSLNLLKAETINSVNLVADILFSFAIFNKVFTECYWSGVFTAKLFEISLKIDDKGYSLFKFHLFFMQLWLYTYSCVHPLILSGSGCNHHS